MGVFEISAAWLILPVVLKNQVPQPYRDNLTTLSTAIVSYQALVSAYNALVVALADAQKVTLAMVPGSTTGTAYIAEEAAKLSAEASKTSLFGSFDPINTFLDTEVPLT